MTCSSKTLSPVAISPDLNPDSQYDLFLHGNGGTVDLNTLDLPPNPQELDRPVTHCGVVGVFNHPEASVMAYYALHSLQHRGQEAAGILAAKTDTNGQAGKRRFTIHKDHGLVLKVFEDSKILTQHLAGDTAIAHNRYSTTGATGKLENVQPFYMHYKHGHFGLAHNGNLTNTREIRERLQDVGTIFQTTTDSELILHLIARSRKTEQIEQIREALQQVRGAYSLVMMTDSMLIAARDPNGFRPLALGRIKRKDGQWGYIVASETCAFDIVNAEYIRDVYPNEIIIIDYRTVDTGEVISTHIVDNPPKASYCIFEYI
ncbi:MAG TPA: class II glutamine amidotransferase, partial [Candidatus Kapabacteria bacterium]|nr:class II glutamine amidotransferase [Candidatus Kapabacteria bacterium]